MSHRSETELRKAQVLIRNLDRLRQDQKRRQTIGYGPRTKTTTADTRRRDLNTRIIHHLHNARILKEQENQSCPEP